LAKRYSSEPSVQIDPSKSYQMIFRDLPHAQRRLHRRSLRERGAGLRQ
jgi:hypothetical protein